MLTLFSSGAKIYRKTIFVCTICFANENPLKGRAKKKNPVLPGAFKCRTGYLDWVVLTYTRKILVHNDLTSDLWYRA